MVSSKTQAAEVHFVSNPVMVVGNGVRIQMHVVAVLQSIFRVNMMYTMEC